jgi:adenosylcobinamide-GDP ribazoletransferase
MAFEIDPHAAPSMEKLAPAVPIAGALIAATGSVVLLASRAVGLPVLPGAVLAVAATVLATGAMHEDAIADLADGFGGAKSVEAKLDIMKDPRLGSFGAAALGLSLLLKVALVAGLTEGGGAWTAALVLAGGGAVARVAGLWPLVALQAARSDGAGAAAGALSLSSWRIGAVLGGVIGVLSAGPAVGLVFAGLALVAGFLAAWMLTRIAERQIGGYTGDVCGAATALAELAFLAAVLARLGP